MMRDLFNPRYLIFTGIAGGVNPEHSIGTIIIADRLAEYQHQKTIRTTYDPNGQPYESFIDTSPGFPQPYFVYDGNKILPFKRVNCVGCGNPNHVPPTNSIVDGVVTATAMDIPMQVETLIDPLDAYKIPVPTQFFFDADPFLLSLAEEVIEENPTLPFQICFNNGDCYNPVAIRGDLGVTAGSFIDNAEYRDTVFNNFLQAGIVTEYLDMESASSAHTSVTNQIPFLVIRAVSDLAGGDALAQINEFLQPTAANLNFFLTEVLRKISESDNDGGNYRRRCKCRKPKRKCYRPDTFKPKCSTCNNGKSTFQINNNTTTFKINDYSNYDPSRIPTYRLNGLSNFRPNNGTNNQNRNQMIVNTGKYRYYLRTSPQKKNKKNKNRYQ